ncbi:MAG: 2-C-methyl-D-erythritol 4-phosphate cytidylyltransferase [Elusimicrobiota bacterium]
MAATDDAALAEQIEVPVTVVPGDARNIKITTPLDLALAEAIFQTWEEK